jgi:hypothetical protein
MTARLHLEPIDHSDSFIGAVDDDDDHRISFKSLSDNGKTALGFHGESLLNPFIWLDS